MKTPISGLRARAILFGLWLLCGLGVAAVWLYMLSQVLWNTRRAWLLALACDDLGNVALGGKLGQTISAKCALACRAGKWWGRWACAVLNWVDPGHCKSALAADSLQDQAP